MSHYYTSHKNLDYANKNNTYISIFYLHYKLPTKFNPNGIK